MKDELEELKEERGKKKEKPVKVEPVAAEQPLISKATWKEIKPVFKCGKCGTFRDEYDAMVEHVLLHFPRSEQEVVFEKLMKEK